MQLQTKITKQGNSYGIPLPKALVESKIFDKERRIVIKEGPEPGTFLMMYENVEDGI
jgi:hypothetical protein